VVRTSGGAVGYEFGNSQGTGTVIIDSGPAQGQLRRMFTPFGAPRGLSPLSWVDNRAFLNQPAEEAAGLNLLGARVYDPATGRFLQRDRFLIRRQQPDRRLHLRWGGPGRAPRPGRPAGLLRRLHRSRRSGRSQGSAGAGRRARVGEEEHPPSGRAVHGLDDH
jgi:RHS repeat-associated protein